MSRKSDELKIKQAGMLQEVILNGTDYGPIIHGVDISFVAGAMPEIRIHPLIHVVDVSVIGDELGRAYVTVPDQTRELLQALGWTPPDDPAESMVVHWTRDEDGAQDEYIDVKSPDYND